MADEQLGDVDEPAAPRRVRVTGAYARRGVRVDPPPVERPPAVEEPAWTGPSWTVVADTTVGQREHRFRDEPTPAAARFALYLSSHVLGFDVEQHGRVTVAAAALFDPAGRLVAGYGDRLPVPGAPRWSRVVRLDAFTWTPCRGCDQMLWPFRLVCEATRRCGECLRAAEAADPRPTWGGEPPLPYLHQQPKWVHERVAREQQRRDQAA